MHPAPSPLCSPLTPAAAQKNVHESALATIFDPGAQLYASHVPYGAPWFLSYW
jgi:hypothetical protein